MFDLVNRPYLPPVDINSFPLLGAISSTIGFNVPAGGYVCAQFAAGMNRVADKVLNDFNGDPAGIKLLKIVDGDLDEIGFHPTNTTFRLGNGGGDVIYRLKEGNERFMVTDVNNPQTSAMAQSSIAAMMDQFGNTGAIQFFNHVPGGCNVLFFDSHVEWVPYVAPSPNSDPELMDLGANQPVLPSMSGIIGLFTAAN
jgi:prepilin-type processing-associated H-X9-DG protein